MPTFKCKMCGGALEVESNASIATCEYCLTTQTLPKIDDERKANLYDRANHFRRNNEFDKAMSIYEQILNEDNTDAEAYWSLVLCRYGIEYVEDPSSHKRVPTVNRAQFTSVFDDDNYKSALQYADGYQKNIYESEANTINELQKGILAISQKEEPFDVFICYKETDYQGRRTSDSVLANDIYHQLTSEGFKVFFAAITLEDKLGTAYEPYIFAALNSAKVMVVLGTKPEYFNAVWVKNEWSRYLALVKNSGGKKMLIPAYKDMDPYDLPEEFSHLQAQDMSKLGFMQDLIRGIKKLTATQTANATVIKETVISNSNANTAPLLKRAFMFLEDGEWTSADEYCEKVLDIDPESAEAYLGKLLSELNVRKQESLKDQAESFDSNSNYQKIVRYGNNELKSELQSYVDFIINRNLTNTYNEAVRIMESAENISNYQSAIKLFESISGWKDSDEKVYACHRKINEINDIEAKAEAERLRLSEFARVEREQKAKKNKIIAIIAMSTVCTLTAFLIVLKTVTIPISNYNEAVALMNEGRYSEALAVFETVGGYKDSTERSVECKLRIIKAGLFTFGKYEQDGNTANGKEDIEWLFLTEKNGKVLVISKYILDRQCYNLTNKEEITWETCTLHSWLNNDFINRAFSIDERAMISTVNVSLSVSEPDNAAKDKVFLLGQAELKYLGKHSYHCKPTKSVSYEDTYPWWLREPSSTYTNSARIVDDMGWLNSSDGLSGHAGVRPALWIDLDLLNF